MRTRTNFVVEYKNNRRLTKGPSSSIWGNLDLKAVARQVEVDNSLPMDVQAEVVSRPVEGAEPMPTQASKAASESSGHTPASHNMSSKAISDPVLTEKRRTPKEPQAAEQTAVRLAKEIKPKPKTIPRKGRDESRRRQAALVTVNHDISDELATLEAENRKLKRLMIIRLRQENSFLKSKLSRFGQL